MKILRDESGSALAMTLILLVILMSLGAGVTVISNSEILQASRYDHKIQAAFNATAGIETLVAVLSEEETFQDLIDEGPGTYPVTLEFDDAGTVDLVIEINDGEGKIVATGHYQSGVDTLSREFSWGSGGSGSGGGSGGDGAPSESSLTTPELNAVNTATSEGWMPSNGQTNHIRTQGGHSDEPIQWTHDSLIVEDYNNSQKIYSAPVMYFPDQHLFDTDDSEDIYASLHINHNFSRMDLESNYLYFAKNVLYDSTSSAFTLKVYKDSSDLPTSQITAEDFSGISLGGENYPKMGDPTLFGLVYFGDTIRVLETVGNGNNATTTAEPFNDRLDSGFYLFPDNTTLTSAGVEALIPVEYDDFKGILHKIGLGNEPTDGDPSIHFGDFL